MGIDILNKVYIMNDIERLSLYQRRSSVGGEIRGGSVAPAGYLPYGSWTPRTQFWAFSI